MIVYAIDPGSKVTGWVAYRPHEEPSKQIWAHGVDDNEVMLDTIADWFVPNGGVIVIEDLELHPQKTKSGAWYIPPEAIETQRYIGRLQQQCLAVSGCMPELLSRRRVRTHLGVKMRQKPGPDSQVRTAMLGRVGPQGTKKAPGPTYGVISHSWQALGLAVTFVDLQSTG